MLGIDNIERVKPGGLELVDRLVAVNRVTKVTKGGRAFGFSAIVVVGNEDGVIGHGLGKSKEVASAISKAVEEAKKNLVRVPVINHTIPHQTSARYGVHDVLSKSKGSSNPHNVVKATFKALLDIRRPEEIARMRGISLNKVFNG